MKVGLGDADAAVGIGLEVVTDFLARADADRPVAEPSGVHSRRGRPDVRRRRPARCTDIRDGDGGARRAEDGAAPHRHDRGAPRRRSRCGPDHVPARRRCPPDRREDCRPDVRTIAFSYDGVEGTPASPVTADDIDGVHDEPRGPAGPRRHQAADRGRAWSQGLNTVAVPGQPTLAPTDSDWAVQPDAHASVGNETRGRVRGVGRAARDYLGQRSPSPKASSLRVPGWPSPTTEQFLDVMLARGAAAKEGHASVDGAEDHVAGYDDGRQRASQITGHVVRAIDTPIIDVAPDVDIDFDGVAIPRLIRGTTAMTMDTSGIDGGCRRHRRGVLRRAAGGC